MYAEDSIQSFQGPFLIRIVPNRLSSRMFKNPFHEVPENYLLLDSADERSREHVSLLVGILSTCKNTDRRRGIRRTWMLLVPEEAWQAIFILGEECARIPEIQVLINHQRPID